MLLANHFDKSLLRNYTAQLLASRLDGLQVSVSCQSVQLYLNGEYLGVYLLCERIEENSLGLTISSFDGGFLLERGLPVVGGGRLLIHVPGYR